MKLTGLYFSPTGTTRKVVKAFAKGFGGAFTENDITLPESRKRAVLGFDPEDSSEKAEYVPLVRTGGPAVDPLAPAPGLPDLAVFAGPVYGGRSFKLLTNTIQKLQGRGCPAVILAVYGGRHYDMALADLYKAAMAAGFSVIACGAFIGEHSFSRNIQTGRPNEEDLALAMDLGRQIREKLEASRSAGGPLAAMKAEDIPQRPVDLSGIGMHRERLGRLTPNRPAPGENCLHCGACAMVCPMGLIDVNDSDSIRPGCLKCNACVKTCPVGAMQFRQEDFRAVAQSCEETFGREARQPEVWFG